MIEIPVVETTTTHERGIRQLHRLTDRREMFEVNHLYDYDGTFGRVEEGWLWAEEQYDEDEDEDWLPRQWSAAFEPPSPPEFYEGGHSGWSYLFEFSDLTDGVCRVMDIDRALRALGYEVDRRGDAGD